MKWVIKFMNTRLAIFFNLIIYYALINITYYLLLNATDYTNLHRFYR
jgi:hypothetical protein